MAKHTIILQAGHLAPREPGFEGGTGTNREQEFALKIRTAQAKLFKADGRFNVIEVPGDIPDGVDGEVALYNHADGSGNPAVSGMSFGYQTPQGGRLADRIRQQFELAGHPGAERADNYTRDLAGYYGFSRTDATHEVLIEHGFLTNPGEAAWMFANIDKLAYGAYKAVLEHLGLSLGPIRSLRIKRVLTAAEIKHRNNLTIQRTDPTGVVTFWQGWRSDEQGANHVLKILAEAPDTLEFRSKFDIAWQGHWFRQDELGVQGIVNVAKSIWSRYS